MTITRDKPLKPKPVYASFKGGDGKSVNRTYYGGTPDEVATLCDGAVDLEEKKANGASNKNGKTKR